MNLKINSEEWLQDEKAKSISYFSIKKPVVVTQALINELKEISKQNKNSNARLCLHDSPGESLHDMIILEWRDKKCRKPHKHLEKDETVQMIEGKMKVFTFSETGELIEEHLLEPKNNFIFRTKKGQYTIYLPLTEHAIYRETKQGPFQQQDNVFPSWSHIKVLEPLVEFDLTCYNSACRTPCALNTKLKKDR